MCASVLAATYGGSACWYYDTINVYIRYPNILEIVKNRTDKRQRAIVL